MAAPYQIRLYRSAQDLPELVWNTFDLHARSANIMYPHALKCRQSDADGNAIEPGQCWIVCSTKAGNGSTSVDFVLSCTRGPLGDYPIFIFTTYPYHQLTSEGAVNRIYALAHHLSPPVPVERVFSVFAPEPLACRFATIWKEYKGIDRVLPEYYAAKLTYCSRENFRSEEHPVPAGTTVFLRLANDYDIPKVAKLCYGFAAESEPFVLSEDKAYLEATILVKNQQLWVHRISTRDDTFDIACIVAVTRSSKQVAAITKVYTNPNWRARGCAERLVRYVCSKLLETKHYVVLYVAHDNPAARVYERVGFVGLGQGPQEDVPGVERWLEIGFDRSRVDLGHW